MSMVCVGGHKACDGCTMCIVPVRNGVHLAHADTPTVPVSFDMMADSLCEYCDVKEYCPRDEPESESCFVAYDVYLEMFEEEMYA